MLRQVIFLASLADILLIGALAAIGLIRDIKRGFNDVINAIGKLFSTTNVPDLPEESTLIGLTYVMAIILFLGNLFLIFATKDKLETSIRCKRILLNIWIVFMVILFGLNLTYFYWKDDWKDFNYGQLTYRVIVFGLGCLYQYKLALNKEKNGHIG